MNPLTYLPDGDDMIIAATKGGAPTNPDWYYNLKRNPRITVEVGTATFAVDATEVKGEEAQQTLAPARPCDRVSPRTRPRHHVSFQCSG